MYIQSLKLEHFRNYESLELEFSPGINLLYGDNAQGKTNILEAIYFCGTTRSHRTSYDRELIQFGFDEAHLRTDFLRNEIAYRIDMHLRKGRSKGIAVNSVPIKSARELVGLGNYILFSPEDLSMIKEGPALRRRFMDMELCQLDKIYVSELSEYNRTLQQRNKLLKDIAFDSGAADTLDVWDMQLARHGKEVIRLRESFISHLSEIIVPIHSSLSGGKEELRVGYEKNVSAEDFEDSLRRHRESDLYTKSTSVGPHRDDLSFVVNGTDIRRFGSQGQQRSAALSLKLSEIELVKSRSGEVPVLLLDDVLSELDTGRQHYLLESIGDIQTFITCTGIEEYEKAHINIDRIYHVEEGRIQST